MGVSWPGHVQLAAPAGEGAKDTLQQKDRDPHSHRPVGGGRGGGLMVQGLSLFCLTDTCTLAALGKCQSISSLASPRALQISCPSPSLAGPPPLYSEHRDDRGVPGQLSSLRACAWAAVESRFLPGTQLSIAAPAVALQTPLGQQRGGQEGGQPSRLRSPRCPLSPAPGPVTATRPFPPPHRSSPPPERDRTE